MCPCKRKKQNVIFHDFKKGKHTELMEPTELDDLELIIKYLNFNKSYYLINICKCREFGVRYNRDFHLFIVICEKCGCTALYHYQTLLKLAKEDLNNRANVTPIK